MQKFFEVAFFLMVSRGRLLWLQTQNLVALKSFSPLIYEVGDMFLSSQELV